MNRLKLGDLFVKLAREELVLLVLHRLGTLEGIKQLLLDPLLNLLGVAFHILAELP